MRAGGFRAAGGSISWRVGHLPFRVRGVWWTASLETWIAVPRSLADRPPPRGDGALGCVMVAALP